MLKTAARSDADYDQDFFLWTREQARLLREHRFAELDLANLIDEVESMGRSEKREIRSRLTVLLAHLLKWKYQPDARKPGWTSTIDEQRQSLLDVLEDNPSLHSLPAADFARAYTAARVRATKETGIAFALFPEHPPFTLEQALDPGFLPREPDLDDQV
ncbi:DUF29 domain-containing protein [Beijerinckia sp. L45]|uniref:DUF29 domain-containing protein n=1 Tax=Beijerinckia sp. L45 TaxID=1641855 RepID=UPI00131BCCE5|nr:DUF29 domain-containing protein [Beijerinckia sp. L45]